MKDIILTLVALGALFLAMSGGRAAELAPEADTAANTTYVESREG